jgi:hypothetical protein
MVEPQQRLLLLAHLRSAEGTINLGCLLELREVWASKSFLSPPGDPGLNSNYLNFMPMHTAKPQR